MTTTLTTKNKSKTNHGKVFEKEFFNSFPSEIFVQRLKDDTMKFANVKNSYDFFAYSYPIIFLFELKTTKQKSLPFANINQYQIDTLFLHNKQSGIIAGFVINFRSHDYQTFFVPAEKVHYHADRNSFPIEWIQQNGINLPATLIRTRYRFDLSPILGDCAI
jgi:penicillin-binding protein-related factor A (putative recombinase)